MGCSRVPLLAESVLNIAEIQAQFGSAIGRKADIRLVKVIIAASDPKQPFEC